MGRGVERNIFVFSSPGLARIPGRFPGSSGHHASLTELISKIAGVVVGARD